MIARGMIALIRAYKKYLSPLLGRHCRFTPTCSEYAMQALTVHGALKGFLLAAWRILRCNPFGRWGYDPVPEKGHWKNPARRLYR
jgi:putative membrane protein insertion efficiency factor